nr:hypothetical protein [Tanacetum cinerariifolium]
MFNAGVSDCFWKAYEPKMQLLQTFQFRSQLRKLTAFLVFFQGLGSLVTGHSGCYDLSTGTPYVDGFDVTPLESTVGHIQAIESNWEFQTVNLTSHVLNLYPTRGVTDGSSLGAIFNHFTGKFNLSPSSQTSNKTAEQKEKSCIVAATVANKEDAAYISVGTDHRKAVVVIVIRDNSSQPLNTEPIPTNGAATQSKPTSGYPESILGDTDRPILNAARNQTKNHAHGTNGEQSSSVHTEDRQMMADEKTKEKDTCESSSSEK